MEDPVGPTGKKKPAFAAFWERQRKDSGSSSSNNNNNNKNDTITSSNEHAVASNSNGIASASRNGGNVSGSHKVPSGQPASTTSSVQRLIQQYTSASASTGNSSASTSASVTPTSSFIRRSSSGRQPTVSASASKASTSASNQSGRTDPAEQSGLKAQAHIGIEPSTLAGSPADVTSSLSTSSQTAHFKARDFDADPDETSDQSKETDAERARRRRKMLKEQLRKRSARRRSATAASNPDEQDDFFEQQDDDSGEVGADAIKPAETPPGFDHPGQDSSRSHNSGRASVPDSASASHVSMELTSSSSSLDGAQSKMEKFYDTESHFSTPIRSTATTSSLSLTAAQAPLKSVKRVPSSEDTRPWLEFSPLLPDAEILDGPMPSLGTAASNADSDSATASEMVASSSQSSGGDPGLINALFPSPSRSTSATTQSNDSPISPTGLGFPSAPPFPTSASHLSINSPTHGSSLRSHRAIKLPPPRPTPSAPLPPPPSMTLPSAAARSNPVGMEPKAQRSSGSQSHREHSPDQRSRTDFSTDIFVDSKLRPRTDSLGQEAAPMSDRAKDRSSSLLAVPLVRQRSDSLQRQERTPPAEPPSARSNASPQMLKAPVGRPRGFTVGAVPSGGSSTAAQRGSNQYPTSNKSRPRSLLSNEIFPGLDLAEPRPASGTVLHAQQGNARSSRSMDAPRHLGLSSVTSTSSQNDGPANANANARPSIGSQSKSHPGAGYQDRAGGIGIGSGAENTDRRPSVGNRSRSGSSASLLQQVNSQPKSHASFVIAVVGHAHSGKSTVIKKGLRQFGLSKPHVLSEMVTSHSTVCVVDQEQRTIEVLEIDASVLLNGPSKRFAWPKFLPRIDAVILCYDASEISSFRGMSELLENFATANLSTVMLACKSEVHPKAVDPYYASDMACVYNVGLAECTVQSEEGKKRMRDCFSYLVKEVAKARSGRTRKGQATTVPSLPSTSVTAAGVQASTSSSQPTESPPSRPSHQPSRSASAHSKDSSQTSSHPSLAEAATVDSDLGGSASRHSPSASISSARGRGYSNASSNLDHGFTSSGLSADGSLTRSPAEGAPLFAGQEMPSSLSSSPHRPRMGSGFDVHVTPRKMSNATVASAFSDAPSFRSEEEALLRDSLDKVQMGLQSARSSGGYVSIDELWDKLFHAAISRTDERFVTTFMVFYRGFATPADLLDQMVFRFESLTHEDVAEGLMHRFALIRLTNMLGDWVQDYPGDLCSPETHAQLLNFHRRLLQHPDTTQTAGQIRSAVEATAHASDLDAVWSRSVNAGQARHPSAADIQIGLVRSGSEADAMPGIPKSSSNNSHSALLSASGNSSQDFDLPVRGNTEQLSGGLQDQPGSDSSLPLQLEPATGGRSRSVSDVTNSSIEAPGGHAGRHGKGSEAGSSAISAASGGGHHASQNHASANSGSMNSNATPSSGTDMGTRTHDQKVILRNVSNALMEIDDEAIATELTRLEWLHFTAIQPRDLLRHILVPHDLRDGPVAKSISHFNYISNWVCSMILVQGKTKHRARMLEKFYNIASILRHDNNYGSLNSVLGGLSKTAVHRLKHTRELLKGKPVNKSYQSLVRLMSNERSSAAYRLALENSDGPTIPYVGVHLQDILSISDGNPSKRASDGMIHWRKFSLMDEAVMAVARCQQYDRYFKLNPGVEKLIVDVPIMDDEALYERSLVVEPRSQGGPTIATSKIKDLKIFLQNQTSSGHGSSFT